MMKDIQTILCPTDFSEASVSAVNYAIEWAQEFGAKVILLHVIEDIPLLTGYVEGVDIESVRLAATNDEMSAFRRKLNPPEDLSMEEVIKTGAPVKTICNVVESESADLLILATHGRTGVSHLLLGSVAERLIREVCCATLTIRPQTN